MTGVSPLDSVLAPEYLARCLATPEINADLPALIDVCLKVLAQGGDPNVGISKIMQDAKLGAVAQQVLYLWYVSAFWLKDPANPSKNPRCSGSMALRSTTRAP